MYYLQPECNNNSQQSPSPPHFWLLPPADQGGAQSTSLKLARERLGALRRGKVDLPPTTLLGQGLQLPQHRQPATLVLLHREGLVKELKIYVEEIKVWQNIPDLFGVFNLQKSP